MTLSFASYKQRMTFIMPPSRDLTACLAVARVADVVAFVANMEDGEETCIDAVRVLCVMHRCCMCSRGDPRCTCRVFLSCWLLTLSVLGGGRLVVWCRKEAPF